MNVNKTDLSNKMEFGSKSTLYSRLDAPENFTLAEMEKLSVYLEMSVKDLSEIIYGNKATYMRHINRIANIHLKQQVK